MNWRHTGGSGDVTGLCDRSTCLTPAYLQGQAPYFRAAGAAGAAAAAALRFSSVFFALARCLRQASRLRLFMSFSVLLTDPGIIEVLYACAA